MQSSQAFATYVDMMGQMVKNPFSFLEQWIKTQLQR